MVRSSKVYLQFCSTFFQNEHTILKLTLKDVASPRKTDASQNKLHVVPFSGFLEVGRSSSAGIECPVW